MKTLYSAVLLALAGCIAGTDGTPDADEASDDRSAPMTAAQRQAEIDKRSDARRRPGSAAHERVPAAASGSITGEVPAELLEKMRDDLAARQGSGSAHIAVVVAESVTWNDGSLGCPQPGHTYTQAIVPGYRVILELAGQRYTYHADANGHFVGCDVQLILPPAGNTPKQ